MRQKRDKISAKSRGADPERRAGILAAAERLFRHYGPLKTTIGEIAREAGIGVGSVYLEFGSKDDIVGELSGRRQHHVLSEMQRAGARGAFAERICRALEARVVALFELSRQGAHSCDLVLCSAAAVKSAHGRFRNDELAYVTELIEKGRKAGEFSVDDPARVAQLIQRAHTSLSPPWIFDLRRNDALALCQEMNELLVRGLLVRAENTTGRRRGA